MAKKGAVQKKKKPQKSSGKKGNHRKSESRRRWFEKESIPKDGGQSGKIGGGGWIKTRNSLYHQNYQLWGWGGGVVHGKAFFI